jgi:hypothetical protein
MKSKHPVVTADSDQCKKHIEMLKRGPANIPEIEAAFEGTDQHWVDYDFTDRWTYYNDLTDSVTKDDFDNKFD